MTPPVHAHSPLLAEVRQLIDAARQRVASAVNAELTQLYWHIGRRISAELLQGQRGEYGKQVVAELARQLTADFGKGWSEQQLRHCLRLAEAFPDEQILSTVQRELSWSHLKALIYIEDPLKRDFYLGICRVEPGACASCKSVSTCCCSSAPQSPKARKHHPSRPHPAAAARNPARQAAPVHCTCPAETATRCKAINPRPLAFNGR